MASGFSSFLQGFTKGFDQRGGFDKLSSWAGRNIAGGEYYEPQQDPVYQKELQRAKESGTPEARQQVVEKYGEYVDTGDQSKEDYFFQPAEGTPQAMEYELAKQQIEQGEQQIEKGDIDIDFMKPLYEQQVEQGKQQIYRQRKENEYLPDQLKKDLEEKDIAIKTGREQLDQARTQGDYLEDEIRLGLANQALNVQERQYQLDELLPLEKDMREEEYEQKKTRGNYLVPSLEAEQNILEQEEEQMRQETDYYDEVGGGTGTGTSDTGTGGPFGPEDIAGTTPGGEVVYRTDEDAYVTMDGNGNMEIYTGELAGQGEEETAINPNRRVTKDPETDEWLSENMAGYLVYEDSGEPFEDDEGNRYYIGKSLYDNKQSIRSTGESNIFDEGGQSVNFADEEQTANDGGPLQNMWSSISSMITGNRGQGSTQSEQTSDGEQEQQTQSMDMQEVINNLKEKNPDLSYYEIAEGLRNRDPEEFRQKTGLPLNSVIDRLRMMR